MKRNVIWYCPKCGKRADSFDRCPTCNVSLVAHIVDFEEFKRSVDENCNSKLTESCYNILPYVRDAVASDKPDDACYHLNNMYHITVGRELSNVTKIWSHTPHGPYKPSWYTGMAIVTLIIAIVLTVFSFTLTDEVIFWAACFFYGGCASGVLHEIRHYIWAKLDNTNYHAIQGMLLSKISTMLVKGERANG